MESWTTPPEYLSILPKLRVLLLGSYHTELGLPRLEALKNYLIQNGLNSCRIAKDFKSPIRMLGEPEDQYNLRKSKYWMRHADILVFVFFPGVDNASVGIELQYAVDNVPGSTWRTILAYYENPPSLISGLGKDIEEFSVVNFSKEKELHEQIYGCIISLLHRFYDIVSNRSVGEWEYSSLSTDCN
ncbi:hypothetical protein DRO64_01280 [Candidatus Bathyarchaeota archaeon]|nr:MAG: hypothetical protein DRO64_01280 [Candidatus Bathyarchaeota archaeon]